MSGLPIRISVRVFFYVACLLVSLFANASTFDAGEVETVLEMIGVMLVFELAMASGPSWLRGRSSISSEVPVSATAKSLVRLGVAVVISAAAIVALVTAMQAQREIRHAREELGELRSNLNAWLGSGDLTTGWTWRGTVWTARTPRDPKWSGERLVSEHMARVLEAQTAQSAKDAETKK